MVTYVAVIILLGFLLFIASIFNPAATGKITDGLYAVRCVFVNFYVLETSDGLAVFDTGINASVAARGLRKLGLSPDAVTRVFLTHTDYDHTGGLAAFPHAARYLSKAEEPMINGTQPRRGFLHNAKISGYHTLENNETVQAGDKTIKMLLTPGHTPGSASYVIDEKIVVTGDLLRLTRQGAVRPFLPLMNMNHRQDIESVSSAQPFIEKASYLLTAHTGIK